MTQANRNNSSSSYSSSSQRQVLKTNSEDQMDRQSGNKIVLKIKPKRYESNGTPSLLSRNQGEEDSIDETKDRRFRYNREI